MTNGAATASGKNEYGSYVSNDGLKRIWAVLQKKLGEAVRGSERYNALLLQRWGIREEALRRGFCAYTIYTTWS